MNIVFIDPVYIIVTPDIRYGQIGIVSLDDIELGYSNYYTAEFTP